jgi:hypothetical protein
MPFADFDTHWEAANLAEWLNRPAPHLAIVMFNGVSWRVQTEVPREILDMALSECHSVPILVVG